MRITYWPSMNFVASRRTTLCEIISSKCVASNLSPHSEAEGDKEIGTYYCRSVVQWCKTVLKPVGTVTLQIYLFCILLSNVKSTDQDQGQTEVSMVSPKNGCSQKLNSNEIDQNNDPSTALDFVAKKIRTLCL